MNENPLDECYRKLMVAIIAQAVCDYRRSKSKATKSWLFTTGREWINTWNISMCELEEEISVHDTGMER